MHAEAVHASEGNPDFWLSATFDQDPSNSAANPAAAVKTWKLGHLSLMGLSPIRSHVTYVGFEFRNVPQWQGFGKSEILSCETRAVSGPPQIATMR